jgi:uncharacterized membrane protein
MKTIQGILSFGLSIVDKLIPDPKAKAEASLKLAELQQNGELTKMANDTELYKADQSNVTDRWKADMTSDSWLSKNIRPMALIAIFVGYFVFAMMSAFGYNANESYVTLLGQWGIIIFGAYFTSRGAEKIMDMKYHQKE